VIRFTCLALVVSMLLLLPVNIYPQEDFLRVTAEGNRQLRLLVLPPTPASGEQNQKIAAEIAEIFKFDFGMTGLFTIVDQPEADIQLKTVYTLTEQSVTLEYRPPPAERFLPNATVPSCLISAKPPILFRMKFSPP